MGLPRTKTFANSSIELCRRAMLWWFAELMELLPRKYFERERPRIEARIEPDGLKVRVFESSSSVQQGYLTQERIEPIALAKAVARRRQDLPVWFFPSEQDVLSRSIQVPRSVLSRFQKLLSTEADRWTSFSSEDVYLAWRLSESGNQGMATVALYFMPRAVVKQGFQALQRHGLEPSSLVFSEPENIRLSLNGPSICARRRARLRSISVAIAAAATFMAVDWVSSAHERSVLRQEIAVERQRLNQQSDLETRIASVVGASADARERSAEARNEFLAALSSVLPPTDWLTDISIRGSEVTLRGYSLDPEALIKALEPLAKDRSVMLQGALSMDKRTDRNQFALAFQLPR